MSPLLAGAGAGAALAFPASLVAQILDGLDPGEEVTTPMWVLLVVALAGAAVAGHVATRTDPHHRLGLAPLAAALALVPSSILALSSRAVSDRDLPWAGLILNAAAAVVLGLLGALVAKGVSHT